MKKIIVSLIWLIGVIPGLTSVIPGLTGNLTAAQPLSANQPWTLEECINYALAHNLSVQQSALQVQQREIDLNTAQNSRLPGVLLHCLGIPIDCVAPARLLCGSLGRQNCP